MTNHRPITADGRQLQLVAGDTSETIDIRWDNEAWTVSGTLPTARVEYVMRMSPDWEPRQMLVFRDLEQPDLWLGTDGQRRWGEVNGAHRPDLDGVTGVYVDDSMFGLVAPVLRLGLAIGDRIEVPMARIDTETLAVVPTRWWFERMSEHRWAVYAADHDRSLSGGRQARVEFAVDANGLPIEFEERSE